MEVKISDLAKLDKISLMKVDNFIERQIKKSQKCRTTIIKEFEKLGEYSMKKEINYQTLNEKTFASKQLSPEEKLIAMAILKELKEKNIEPEEEY